LDAGIFVCTCPFVEHGDDMLFYYGGGRYSHGWSINPDFSLRTDIDRTDERASEHVMLAKIKRDRFASLACTYKACFDVDAGHRLSAELLANVLAPQGQVRVAIAEKAGDYHAALSKHDSLPGFSFADCIPITGDQVHASVRFKNTRLADIPSDKPINLRFELTRAEVFGYEWKMTGN
jgi:hypothetical protein